MISIVCIFIKFFFVYVSKTYHSKYMSIKLYNMDHKIMIFISLISNDLKSNGYINIFIHDDRNFSSSPKINLYACKLMNDNDTWYLIPL